MDGNRTIREWLAPGVIVAIIGILMGCLASVFQKEIHDYLLSMMGLLWLIVIILIVVGVIWIARHREWLDAHRDQLKTLGIGAAILAAGFFLGLWTAKLIKWAPPPLVISEEGEQPLTYAGKRSTHLFRVSGGEGPYHWSLLAKTAEGISLNPQNNTIFAELSVLAIQSGLYSTSIQACNLENVCSKPYEVDLIVLPPPLPVISAEGELSPIYAGALSTRAFGVSGGEAPYEWHLLDQSHQGISLKRQSETTFAKLSVFVHQPGSYSASIQVCDLKNVCSKPYEVTLMVLPPPLPVISAEGELSPIYAGALSTRRFRVSGGEAPYEWHLLDQSHQGISLRQQSETTFAELSVRVPQPGSYSARIQAYDQTKVCSKPYVVSLRVLPPPLPVISAEEPLPKVQPGMPAKQRLRVSGGKAPYIWNFLTPPTEGVSIDAQPGTTSAYLSIFVQESGPIKAELEVCDTNLVCSQPYDVNVEIVGHPPFAVKCPKPLYIAHDLDLPAAEKITSYGGIPPYGFLAFGYWPRGAAIDPHSGEVRVGPEAPIGESNMQVVVRESGSETKQCNLKIVRALIVKEPPQSETILHAAAVSCLNVSPGPFALATNLDHANAELRCSDCENPAEKNPSVELWSLPNQNTRERFLFGLTLARQAPDLPGQICNEIKVKTRTILENFGDASK